MLNPEFFYFCSYYSYRRKRSMNQILEVRRGDGSMSKVAIGNVIGGLEKFLP